MKNLKKLKKVEAETMTLATLQEGLTLNSLSNPETLTKAFSLIREYFKKPTITPRQLQIALNRDLPATDIARNIATGLAAMPDEEAFVIWRQCNRFVKSELLVCGGQRVDIAIYDRFELMPVAITRAFFYQKAFKTPANTPYSRHYSSTEIEVAEDFIEMLDELDPLTRMQVLEETSVKILYLFAAKEIDYLEETDPDRVADLFSALHYHDTVPQEAEFLNYVQMWSPKAFNALSRELTNRDWEELRNMFYELRYRSRNYGTISDEEYENLGFEDEDYDEEEDPFGENSIDKGWIESELQKD